MTDETMTPAEELIRDLGDQCLEWPVSGSEPHFQKWLIHRIETAEAESYALRERIDELHATIVERNRTITEREAEIVGWQDSYYGLEERIDELETATTWRPISEPPEVAGEYLGWNGYRVEIVRYLPENEDDETDWPWRDWYDDEINISQWVSFSAPPTEAPAP